MPPGSEVVYCRSKKPAELRYMTFIKYTLTDQKVQKKRGQNIKFEPKKIKVIQILELNFIYDVRKNACERPLPDPMVNRLAVKYTKIGMKLWEPHCANNSRNLVCT